MSVTMLSIFVIFLVQSYLASAEASGAGKYLYMELINTKTQINSMYITDEAAYGSFTFSLVNPTAETFPIHYGKPEPYRLNGHYNVTGLYFLQPRIVYEAQAIAELKWEDPKKEWIFVYYPSSVSGAKRSEASTQAVESYWAAFPARPGLVLRPNQRITWLLSNVKMSKDDFMYPYLNDNIVPMNLIENLSIFYNYSLLFLPGTPSLTMSVTASPTTLTANTTAQSVRLTFHNPTPNSKIPSYTLGNEYLHTPEFEIDFYDIIPLWTGYKTGTQQQIPIYDMRWLISGAPLYNPPNANIVASILPSNGFKKRDGDSDQRGYQGFFLTEAGTKYDTIELVVSGIKPAKTGRGKIVIRTRYIHQTIDTNFEIPITIQ